MLFLTYNKATRCQLAVSLNELIIYIGFVIIPSIFFHFDILYSCCYFETA